jgi:hypothetical protein
LTIDFFLIPFTFPCTVINVSELVHCVPEAKTLLILVLIRPFFLYIVSYDVDTRNTHLSANRDLKHRQSYLPNAPPIHLQAITFVTMLLQAFETGYKWGIS